MRMMTKRRIYEAKMFWAIEKACRCRYSLKSGGERDSELNEFARFAT
jgi:hypothetical protein